MWCFGEINFLWKDLTIHKMFGYIKLYNVFPVSIRCLCGSANKTLHISSLGSHISLLWVRILLETTIVPQTNSALACLGENYWWLAECMLFLHAGFSFIISHQWGLFLVVIMLNKPLKHPKTTQLAIKNFDWTLKWMSHSPKLFLKFVMMCNTQWRSDIKIVTI